MFLIFSNLSGETIEDQILRKKSQNINYYCAILKLSKNGKDKIEILDKIFEEYDMYRYSYEDKKLVSAVIDLLNVDLTENNSQIDYPDVRIKAIYLLYKLSAEQSYDLIKKLIYKEKDYFVLRTYFEIIISMFNNEDINFFKNVKENELNDILEKLLYFFEYDNHLKFLINNNKYFNKILTFNNILYGRYLTDYIEFLGRIASQGTNDLKTYEEGKIINKNNDLRLKAVKLMGLIGYESFFDTIYFLVMNEKDNRVLSEAYNSLCSIINFNRLNESFILYFIDIFLSEGLIKNITDRYWVKIIYAFLENNQIWDRNKTSIILEKTRSINMNKIDPLTELKINIIKNKIEEYY